MKKYFIFIVLTMILTQCFFAPTTQRANCEVKKSKLGTIDTTCGVDLLFWSYAADTINESLVDGVYFYFINECLKLLEYEEKCKEASPYIPVWPAEQ